MKVLSDDQRARLLKALEGAPDEVLCSAVGEMKRMRVQIQDDYKDVAGFIGREETKLKEPEQAVDEIVGRIGKPESAFPEAKPEKPPGVACSRVGGETRDAIKAKCTVPSTCAEINKFLRRSEGKLKDTESILKLLWDRNELIYVSGTYRNKS